MSLQDEGVFDLGKDKPLRVNVLANVLTDYLRLTQLLKS